MIVVCLNGSIKEGLVTAGPYSNNTKKLELLNELKGLSDKARNGTLTSYSNYSLYFDKPYSTQMTNGTQTDELVEFIKGMSSTKMEVLRNSSFLTLNVNAAIRNMVDENENNNNADKRVTNSNTLETAQRAFNNKVNG